MDRDELAGWLRLAHTPGLGNGGARKLLAAFGLPAAVLAQPALALQQLLSASQCAALAAPPEGFEALLDTTAAWLAEAPDHGGARGIVTLADPGYPPGLLATADPPVLLYWLGHPVFMPNRARAPAGAAQPAIESIAQDRCIAIVGTRNPTPQGAINARAFGRALAEAGLTVVSGLALGVDGAAHEGALDGAAPGACATIAVVGTGLDRVYPQRHRDLAHRIALRGALVSEYPLGTPPLPPNFPKRNRIIAGLSLGTLVVEAAQPSGSLITARLAVEQGKDVFAIPGSIHAPQSRGCHALIKQGAKLVESAADILEELQLPGPIAAAAAAAVAGEADAAGSGPLLDALGHDPVGIDALVARTGMPASDLQVQLLTLELDGCVGRLPGGLFQRLGRA